MANPSPEPLSPRRPSKRRWWLVVTILAVVVVVALLGLIFIPVHSQSQQVSVSTGASADASFTLPAASWVTVHFSHPGTMAMMYWMSGSSGMMFDHRGMMGGDSYSFWSNGGTFHCWAAFDGAGYGPTPVWMNATWGLL